MENNYIPTKKKRSRYTFASSVNDFRPQPELKEKKISFFFQIATFQNSNGRYHMRKFVVSPENTFLNIEDYFLNKGQCKKFYKIKKSNQYKTYNVNDLNDIPPPTLNDIYTLKSENLTSGGNLDSMYETFTNDNKSYIRANNRKLFPKVGDNGVGRLNTLNNFSKF